MARISLPSCLPCNRPLCWAKASERSLSRPLPQLDPTRVGETRGATKATSVLGLVVSPLVLLFALSSGEIEQFLWHGKWQSAVPAIQLLAMVVPIHLLVDVSRMIIQADGRFRLWTTTVFLRGASLAAAVLLAGALGGGQNATIVAACVAAFIAVGGLGESTLLFHKASLPLSLVWRSFLTPYFASLLGAAVAWRCLPQIRPRWFILS